MYTNVFLADPDLPAATTGDIRRLVPRQVSSKLNFATGDIGGCCRVVFN